ncbi:hypothetical protein ACRALDRAFT_2025099 [Sodiomyces alcalophilus JCM 7366]|uniref:uncharacterized protein n=1 Tax=Sodiomyces alcalophilus JCM 7366 TaxID=591952 RepID=UPI0039B485FA
MIAAGASYSHQRQHSHGTRYRSASRPGDSTTADCPSSNPRYRRTVSGASRFPTPPSSSSPSVDPARAQPRNSQNAQGDNELIASRASDAVQHDPKTVVGPSASSSSASIPLSVPVPVAASPRTQQPSPNSDTNRETAYQLADATSPRPPPGGQTIHIRDLAHIQNLARTDMLREDGTSILNNEPSQQVKYEISGMPIGDVIEMVAALLTKITTTNDLQHDAMQRNVAHQQQASQNNESANGSQISPLSASVLAFHGKNIPAITILSYLTRIHKYCPTTFEVFLSLLVYFDRMTERVNHMVMQAEERRQAAGPQSASSSRPTSQPAPSADVEMRDEESDVTDETDSDLVDDDDEEMEEEATPRPRAQQSRASGDGGAISRSDATRTMAPPAYFVVDSFNIHRLIVAGVTCASKFFSDVFYTNSRYAKVSLWFLRFEKAWRMASLLTREYQVGGLPLAELNHLELQFLLLNDFRLAIPVEDLEAYATMLVEFYAREVVRPQAMSGTGDS